MKTTLIVSLLVLIATQASFAHANTGDNSESEIKRPIIIEIR